MPKEEETKSTAPKRKTGTKGKTRGKKKVTYKDKKKAYQFNVTKAPSGGERLAIELARQQYASVQQEKERAERLRLEEMKRLNEERKAEEKRLKAEEQRLNDQRKAEEQRLKEERKLEEKRQKEIMDEYKARAEADRKALEKFQQQTEPTLNTILSLYRSLSKDPKSFVAEQEKMGETVAEFTDVLASLGMDPERARIKATEASLLDLVERRQDEAKKEKKNLDAIRRADYLDLVRVGWSEEEAKQLADILTRRKDSSMRGETLKHVAEIQELRAVMEKAYKKKGWTPSEIETKIRLVEGGRRLDLLDFEKPTEEEMVSLRVIPRPMMEEVPSEKEAPLPSGSAGPPPLMKEEAPAPFPPPAPAEVSIPEVLGLVPNVPADEFLKELDQFWANRKGSETDFTKQVKEALRSAPPELPPELTPITKAGSDYWTRVITDGSISTARLPQEEKEEGTIIPFQENALLAGLKRTLRGDKEPRPVEEQPVRRYPRVDQTIPPAPFPPIPPYQPPQYTAPKKKTPGREYRLQEPITYYDPTNPVLPSPGKTATEGTIIPFQENALLAGLKRTLRGDREPRPVEEQPVRRFPRVDTEPMIQGLPPAFGGGGGGPPPMQFDEGGPASSQRIFTSSDY